jgi:hypothetical protein
MQAYCYPYVVGGWGRGWGCVGESAKLLPHPFFGEIG